MAIASAGWKGRGIRLTEGMYKFTNTGAGAYQPLTKLQFPNKQYDTPTNTEKRYLRSHCERAREPPRVGGHNIHASSSASSSSIRAKDTGMTSRRICGPSDCESAASRGLLGIVDVHTAGGDTVGDPIIVASTGGRELHGVDSRLRIGRAVLCCW